MTRAVICGDLHMYHDAIDREVIRSFVDMLENDPPDHLILGGDIYELWRGDMFGAGWSTGGFTESLRRLRDRGVNVQYVVGNHDEWAIRHIDADQGYPFEPRMDYRFSVDGVKLFVTHGHKYEPAYNPVTNDLLSVTNDHFGQLASDLWGARPQLVQDGPLSEPAALLLGPAASFLDSEAIQDHNLRRRPIVSGVNRESGDDWGIYGHIHQPYIDADERVANWGSMTGGQRGYVEVSDGCVELKRVG